MIEDFGRYYYIYSDAFDLVELYTSMRGAILLMHESIFYRREPWLIAVPLCRLILISRSILTISWKAQFVDYIDNNINPGLAKLVYTNSIWIAKKAPHCRLLPTLNLSLPTHSSCRDNSPTYTSTPTNSNYYKKTSPGPYPFSSISPSPYYKTSRDNPSDWACSAERKMSGWREIFGPGHGSGKQYC